MTRNVFIEKSINCPVCKNTFELKYPNPKLYAAASRDSDRRVTGYTWAQGLKTNVVPHYYAVAQCPQCLFADLKENFENPRYGARETFVYEARNSLDFKKVLILKKLRRLVQDDETLSLEGAMSMHLTAVYCALLPAQKEQIDHNKLGRLYLRLSWLYRELKGDEPPTGENGDSDSPALAKLKKSVEVLQSDLLSMLDDLGSTSTMIRERAKELGLPEEGEENPYFPILMALTDKTHDLQTYLEMLQQSVQSDRKGDLTTVSIGSNGTDDAVQKILVDVASKWPGMPRTEEISIKRAVEAFDYSFKHEDTEQSIEQSLGVVNLIVKLLLKIGDLDGALDYIMQIFKSGFRDKQELQRRLSQGKREKTLSDFDARNIQRKIATVTNSLTQAGDTRKMLLEKIYERDKEKITATLNDNANNSPEQQQEALVAAGLTEELIPFLKDRGLIKVEEEKKGWFGRKK
jgi:hypothetical protein